MNHLTDSQLNEYLDAALEPAARRRVELHLQGCASCRARLHDLQFVFSNLATLPEIGLARDLSRAVLAQLANEQVRPWSPGFAAQLGAALGGVVWLAGEAVKAMHNLDLSFLIFSIPQMVLPPFKLTFPQIHFIIPSPQLIDIGWANFSTFSLALLIASAGALWVVGNAALLRAGIEQKS